MIGGTFASISMAFFLFVAGWTMTNKAQAQQKPDTSTAIVQCYYHGFTDSNPVSAVTRVEMDGPLQPKIWIYMPCVEAFNTLIKAGFWLAHSFVGATEGGNADGSDFTVWRTRYETCLGSRGQ